MKFWAEKSAAKDKGVKKGPLPKRIWTPPPRIGPPGSNPIAKDRPLFTDLDPLKKENLALCIRLVNLLAFKIW